MLLFPGPRAAEVTRAYRDFVSNAPDEVGAPCVHHRPAGGVRPEPARGKPVGDHLLLRRAGRGRTGRLRAAARARARARHAPADALLDRPEADRAGNPTGMQNYWSADFLADLPDRPSTSWPSTPPRDLAAHADHPHPGRRAISRVPEDAWRSGSARRRGTLHHLGMWPEPADGERQIGFIRSSRRRRSPTRRAAPYLNFNGDEGATASGRLGPEKYQKLVALKDRYDPGNLFKLNQNIPPTTARTARAASRAQALRPRSFIAPPGETQQIQL